MKKLLRVLLYALAAVLAAALLLFCCIILTEYKPEPVATAELYGTEESAVKTGEAIKLLSWNIGYCGLGEEADFFMDGGSGVYAESRETVEKHLEAISAFIDSESADFALLQEVDKGSTRSFGINEVAALSEGKDASFAYNYKCIFVPIPVPPLAKVESGLLTLAEHDIAEAERHALPCPFSWPMSAANLKRCLLVSYVPIENSDRQLVVVNAHLEAYDSGEGKIAQTKQLREFIEGEYEKGNYVIVGGDFNQLFPECAEVYKLNHPELWQPGSLERDILGEGWSFVNDPSEPSCRLLNQPYEPEDTENTDYYCIDGFIISPNVTLESVETVNLGFKDSDHNPVRLVVRLEAC